MSVDSKNEKFKIKTRYGQSLFSNQSNRVARQQMDYYIKKQHFSFMHKFRNLHVTQVFSLMQKTVHNSVDINYISLFTFVSLSLCYQTKKKQLKNKQRCMKISKALLIQKE
jgi:hypothetical protein